ncbi:MAG: helix-turn-helix domain-containing protein [Pseudonocardia sp.]|nr:helix-turn-helix domain-containing protein [Pseudonocardia sp.]
MSGLASPTRSRLTFGGRLRTLRQQSGMTGDALARSLGWHPSKVSRTELGHRGATAADVTDWVAALGRPPALAAELLAELREVQVEHLRLRRIARTGMARHQRRLSDVDNATTMIRALELTMVPGLLQTPEYAREMFAIATRSWPVSDIKAGIAERMQRQSILRDPERTVHLIISEAALRWRVCPPFTMASQLHKLLADVGDPSLHVRILPLGTRLPALLLHGFWIYDEQLVRVETVTTQLVVRDPDDIAVYADRFTLLWESSTAGDDARALIARVLDDLDVE